MLTCVALDYGNTLTDPQAAVQPHNGTRSLTPAAAHVTPDLRWTVRRGPTHRPDTTRAS